MGKVKHGKKGIDWNKIGKGLSRGLIALDRAGKRDADWFFGADLKQPEREFTAGFDAEAEEFFHPKKSKKNDKGRDIIIIRG